MTKQESLAYKVEIGADYYGAKVIRELPLKKYPSGISFRQFECLCKCGKLFPILLDSLVRPTQHMCIDCRNNSFRKPTASVQCKYPRLWTIYDGILYRCNRAKPNTPAWKYYRGRGITVCKEWEKDFMSFVNWAYKNGYQPDLSIDRIDVNGNYEPKNCRWATAKQQANNQRARRSIFNVVIDGKVLNLKTASEIYNIPYSRLVYRYQKGIRGEKLLKPPKIIQKKRSIGFY